MTCEDCGHALGEAFSGPVSDYLARVYHVHKHEECARKDPELLAEYESTIEDMDKGDEHD